MALDITSLQNAAVGPTKLYIYKTTNTLAAGSTTFFNTTDAPGLSAGDIIMLGHGTNSKFAILRITAIDATSSTYVSIVAS